MLQSGWEFYLKFNFQCQAEMLMYETNTIRPMKQVNKSTKNSEVLK